MSNDEHQISAPEATSAKQMDYTYANEGARESRVQWSEGPL